MTDKLLRGYLSFCEETDESGWLASVRFERFWLIHFED